MAQVTFGLMASKVNTQPGQIDHWVWNNAPNNRVWLFSVQPYIWDPVNDNDAKGEVTRVYYRVKVDPSEREVHVFVKNVGTSMMGYDLFMSSIRA
jgi:hypothetical protein